MSIDTKSRDKNEAFAKKAKGAYHVGLEQKETEWNTVENYLPLVKSIVARMRIYFPESVEVEDIYSVALAGLISAVRNYDSSKGKHFGSYAKVRIRGSILDELRRIDWLTRDERQKAKYYNGVVEELTNRFKRPPTDIEICKEMEISSKEQSKIIQMKRPIYHLPIDMPAGESDGDSPLFYDILSDPTELDGRDIAENHELIELLKNLIGELEVTQQRVLMMYYLEGLRLGEIAVVLGLTESRICQIHGNALSLLRRQLNENMSS